MTLPLELSRAIDGWLERSGGKSRRGATASLSQIYRGGGSSSEVDIGAYLTTRLPATYAAVARVLAEAKSLRPDLAPRSLLDVGAGPGTASWAALATWPGIGHVGMLDASDAMLSLARELALESGSEALTRAAFGKADVRHLPAMEPASLAVMSYALAEMPEAEAGAIAARLWTLTGDMLVIVEPGTPAGFSRIRRVRQSLLAEGAVPVAPCPHAGACPMAGDDWCHFSARLPRRRAHMHAKGAVVPFEDERFSFLAVCRSGLPSGGGRIVRPPRLEKPGLTLRLCTEAGLVSRHIARRDKGVYKKFRRLGWGDLMSADGS